MIFALIGQSSSGKSTIERRLEQLGYSRIVSYTTRPMRSNEEDGVDYHFVDQSNFNKLHRDGFFTEIATYRDCQYGLSLDGIDYINNTYVVVVTLHGYYELLKAVGRDNIVSIYISVPERERIIRQLKRGDDVDEVIRRIHTDRVDFSNVEAICDYVVMNESLETSIYSTNLIIKGRLHNG